MKCRLNIGFVLSAIAMLLSGCSGILYTLIGAHEAKMLDEETILYYSRLNKIPEKDNYILDTAFFSFVSAWDTAHYRLQKKNHLQPLQALYYNKQDNLQVFIINCYAGGFPNLKWNRKGSLDTFLPKRQAPVDSLLPLETLMQYVKPLPGAALPNDSSEYTVVVMWNYFMERQSKRLIKAIRKNTALAKGSRIRLIYINNDNLFAGKF